MAGLTVLLVAVGGFVGAPARAELDRLVSDKTTTDFPLGTFAVNVSGSLLLGVLVGLALSGRLPSAVGDLVGTGFCGAFTTFSTFSFETLRLLEERDFLLAAANVALSLLVGLGAAGAGLAVGLLV